MKVLLQIFFILLGTAIIGINCSPENNSDDDVLDGGFDSDIEEDLNIEDTKSNDIQPDNPFTDNQYEDSNVEADCEYPNECDNQYPTGCRHTEICNNGLDDNCNGTIDEGCNCKPGDVQRCFSGMPGRNKVGACEEGQQVCVLGEEFGYWGECKNETAPTDEICDKLDNDCNGCIDEGLCCSPFLNCPAPGDPRISNAEPFQNYQLRGTMFYTGPAKAWHWEVEGTPCDELLESTTGATTFSVAGSDNETLELFFVLSGDYKITMVVTDTEDHQFSCSFIIHVFGPGLRVELCWDTTGSTDLDLHLHQSGDRTHWFEGSYEEPAQDPHECFFRNCRGSNAVTDYYPDWGYADTDLENCKNGPNGTHWLTYGACRNPRLDIDNISEIGNPENINIDNPSDGDVFRVMVHYFGSDGGDIATHPMVNVYCGGKLMATYGASPDLVQGFNHPGTWAMGPMWRVVDITTFVNENGEVTDCDLEALKDPENPNTYWVTNDDSSY